MTWIFIMGGHLFTESGASFWILFSLFLILKRWEMWNKACCSRSTTYWKFMARSPLQWRQCSCHDRGVAPWSRWIRSDRKAAERKWMGESSCSGWGCHIWQGKLCHPCLTSQTDMIRPWGICCSIKQTKSWGLRWCWHYIIIGAVVITTFSRFVSGPPPYVFF